MAVTLTKEFWTNLVLFVVACVALGLSIWAFNVPCKKDKFGDFNYIGLSESQTPLQACSAAPGFHGDPIPSCSSPDANPHCGNQGDKKDKDNNKCSDDSLGYMEACDPRNDKCCGNYDSYLGYHQLKCLPDSVSCPTCK